MPFAKWIKDVHQDKLKWIIQFLFLTKRQTQGEKWNMFDSLTILSMLQTCFLYFSFLGLSFEEKQWIILFLFLTKRQTRGKKETLTILSMLSLPSLPLPAILWASKQQRKGKTQSSCRHNWNLKTQLLLNNQQRHHQLM